VFVLPGWLAALPGFWVCDAPGVVCAPVVLELSETPLPLVFAVVLPIVPVCAWFWFGLLLF